MTRTLYTDLYEANKCNPKETGTYLALIDVDGIRRWDVVKFEKYTGDFENKNVTYWAELPNEEDYQ